MSAAVRLLIHAEDGPGEGLWATRTAAPGIFELDNFPISPVNYTCGDVVMAAGDGAGHLYITGLAERRFRAVYLRCNATDEAEPEVRARHRAIAQHPQAAGVRVEGLIPGWIGAAIPVGMSEQTFGQVLASASYPIRKATDADMSADV
jgi:hypothetical protein